MPTWKHPDFIFSYDEQGSGLPILFIHGYPLNRKMWAPQLADLSENYRLIAPDLRGHGESTPSAGPYSMEMFADDCASLLEHLRINQPAIVCGLSMGGYISLAFARKYPHMLRGLILTATRAAEDSPDARSNRQRSMDLIESGKHYEIFETMLPRLLSPLTQQNNPALVSQIREIMETTNPSTMISDLKGMMSRPDSRPFLPDIRVPTLIIHGKDDPLIPYTEAQEMASALPNCQLVILENTAHLPNLEASQAFNRHVRIFLSQFS